MDNYERKNRISEALNIRNMKQVELCEKANIKKASLSHWIKQNWQPKQYPLMSMAKALDVSEMWLAGYDVPMERAPEQKKADELAKLIHQLRGNDNLIRIMTYASKLSSSQLLIVEGMLKELTKFDQ